VPTSSETDKQPYRMHKPLSGPGCIHAGLGACHCHCVSVAVQRARGGIGLRYLLCKIYGVPFCYFGKVWASPSPVPERARSVSSRSSGVEPAHFSRFSSSVLGAMMARHGGAALVPPPFPCPCPCPVRPLCPNRPLPWTGLVPWALDLGLSFFFFFSRSLF